MNIVIAPKMAHEWLCSRVHYIPTPEMVCIAAVTLPEQEGGEVIIHGMTGLDDWTVGGVQAHICIEDPKCARQLLRASFQYCFDNDRNVVVGITPSDLPRAVRFMKGIGFKELCRIKDGNAPGIDTIISEVRAETCRWASPRDLKEEAA